MSPGWRLRWPFRLARTASGRLALHYQGRHGQRRQLGAEVTHAHERFGMAHASSRVGAAFVGKPARGVPVVLVERICRRANQSHQVDPLLGGCLRIGYVPAHDLHHFDHVWILGRASRSLEPGVADSKVRLATRSG